jgi:hypothetical protein
MKTLVDFLYDADGRTVYLLTTSGILIGTASPEELPEAVVLDNARLCPQAEQGAPDKLSVALSSITAWGLLDEPWRA